MNHAYNHDNGRSFPQLQYVTLLNLFDSSEISVHIKCLQSNTISCGDDVLIKVEKVVGMLVELSKECPEDDDDDKNGMHILKFSVTDLSHIRIKYEWEKNCGLLPAKYFLAYYSLIV